jgi:membrane protein involved in colicin uptake
MMSIERLEADRKAEHQAQLKKRKELERRRCEETARLNAETVAALELFERKVAESTASSCSLY